MENQPMPEQPMQPAQPVQSMPQPMPQSEPMAQPAMTSNMGAAPVAKPKKKWVLPTIIGLSVAAVAAVVAIVLIVVLNGGKNLTCDFGSMGKLTVKYNDEKILDVTADGQMAQSMSGMTIDEMNQEYTQELKGRITMEEYMSITGYMLNSWSFGMGQCTLNGNTITKPAKYDEIMNSEWEVGETEYYYDDGEYDDYDYEYDYDDEEYDDYDYDYEYEDEGDYGDDAEENCTYEYDEETGSYSVDCSF